MTLLDAKNLPTTTEIYKDGTFTARRTQVRDLPEGARFKAAGTWYTLKRLGQGSAVVTIGEGGPQQVTIGDRTFTANNAGRLVTISLGTVVEAVK